MAEVFEIKRERADTEKRRKIPSIQTPLIQPRLK